MQEAGAEVDPGGRRWCRHPWDGLPPGLCQADPGREGRWNSFPRGSVVTAYDSFLSTVLLSVSRELPVNSLVVSQAP